MTSDLAKLMEKISLLQSEPTPKPIIEIEKPTMHPLLQAMQELKEDGVVESVDAHTIYSNVQSGHREPDDFVEGDIGDRIYWFDDYKLSSLPISNLNLDEHYVDEDLVDDYIEHIKYSPKTMPPIVYDPIAKSIIDGIHRANAYAKLGYETIPAYVGLTKSDSYGERESDNIDEEIAYHGTVDDIAEFYPLSHFGTEKAAKDRMEYKKIKDGKIYKVDLDIKNPLTIKDFPGIHYDRLYAFELRDKKLISQKEMEAITTIDDKAELRKALLTKLNDLGIDGFVYKNKYEDKGNLSYVIVDPSQVKVLSVEPATEELDEYNIRKTKKFIQRAHDQEQGQMYGDMPYSSHPKQVANLGKKFFGPKFNDEAVKVALLHDVLEDTPYTPEQLAKKGFSKEVIQAVQLLTKNKALSYADNIRNIINSGNPLAMMVKYSDNYMNYSGDKSHWDADRAAHSQKKYLASLNMLGDVLGIKKHVGEEPVTEASLNTLEGSFTPDLVESKTWLAEMLAKGLKGKNAGTIYVLGSWYGNMGIFLQQADIKFDKLVLIEPNEKWLMQSKELLQQIGDEGKLVLIHQKAEDAVYEKPGVVINTSCNETGPVFLTKLPDNMLCLLQARNNVDSVLIETDSLEEFTELFPLNKTYYTGEKTLTDPETEYDRYMIIGRSGGKLEEDHHTGGGLGLPFPGTYEQEYDKFKSKGPRRITAMTNEALDSSYEYTNKEPGRYHFETEDGIKYKVFFGGKDLVEVSFSAIMPGETNTFRPDKTTLTGTGNSRKVFGTVVKIVKEYLEQHKPNALFFSADSSEPSRIKLYNTLISQVDKVLPDYHSLNNIDLGSGTAYMLSRKEEQVAEALDSSYPYEFKNNAYYFITDSGNDYKVMFNGTKKVEVSFMARGENDQPKDDITGTGDSRKIFGTVINIVKEYVGQHQPDIVMFAANNGEPSRIRLYNMLASQAGKALPGYNFVKTLKGSLFTTFYLTRDNIKVPKLDTVKNVAGRVLDKVVGE